jgi:hypothetical protein
MNVIRTVLFLLTVFNNNISLENVNPLINGTEYVLEYDENVKIYENNTKTVIQDGCYKLYYIDENINGQIIYYNNFPLTFSVKIREFREEETAIINKLVTMLGYKSSEYYNFTDGKRYYYKHIYSNEIVFIIFDYWLETNFKYMWIFTDKHPLNYISPIN